MRDSRHGGQGDSGSGGLTVLARTVVERLATRDMQADRPVDPLMVASIARALVMPGISQFETVQQDLRRARITEIDLVDSYFPAVARHLGCAWVEDSAPFTEVTVGVARMQAILRQVGRDWTSNAVPDREGRAVLVILPEGEQHSFGAMVLAGQLRRQGISVRLEIGTSTRDLHRIAQQSSFDCAMISISCEEKLGQCKSVVTALKTGANGSLWVAVGGALLDRPVDVKGRTGADVVTCDPAAALRSVPVRRSKQAWDKVG